MLLRFHEGNGEMNGQRHVTNIFFYEYKDFPPISCHMKEGVHDMTKDLPNLNIICGQIT